MGARVSKSELGIAFPNGSQILFAGLDDPEKLKSIYAITGVWIEEASEITEELRPGSTRRLTDDEVKAKVRKLKSQLDKTADAIARYEQA